MDGNIIFIDTETTGIPSAKGANLDTQPYITEIHLTLTDSEAEETLEEFSTLIKVPITIPDFITKITGISNETLIDSPSFLEINKKVKKLIKQANTFVAQNLRFDKDMIDIEYQRINKKIKWPKNLFCTVEQSMHLKGFRLKSTELYLLSNKDAIQGIHRAKADVLAMIEYYKYIVNSPTPSHFFKENPYVDKH